MVTETIAAERTTAKHRRWQSNQLLFAIINCWSGSQNCSQRSVAPSNNKCHFVRGFQLNHSQLGRSAPIASHCWFSLTCFDKRMFNNHLSLFVVCHLLLIFGFCLTVNCLLLIFCCCASVPFLQTVSNLRHCERNSERNCPKMGQTVSGSSAAFRTICHCCISCAIILQCASFRAEHALRAESGRCLLSNFLADGDKQKGVQKKHWQFCVFFAGFTCFQPNS